ncbi:malonyl-CoA decarboxylase [Fulvimarina sp. MAC3]|uniref:malonyl-CoA decarboxylase n=1 Tax=Fulvimarina sp. MAC3 TaxID=3148887 RepID=UPI0031FDDD64
MSRVSLLSDLLGSLAPRAWFSDREAERTVSVGELRDLCRKLVRSKGEATGVRIAANILAGLRGLDAERHEAFFRMLADDFSPDPKALVETARAFAADPGPTTLARLQHEAEPPRQELFRRLNLAPGGTAELVKLREKLLPLVAKDRETFKPVDMDLRHLFGSWFNRGFLVLKPIDWNTSAKLLEKIIEYEAVHAIDSWDALRSRLAPSDRRCFAFFHPSIPDDPLIFVEVALTREIPASIGEVLTDEREHLAANEAETATFYSISNCHKGLAGVSFGSFLIKQVAEDLKESIPNLKTFVTLSPVPTFMAWLRDLDEAQKDQLETSEKRALTIIEDENWAFDEEKAEAAKAGLLSLAARYFLLARRGDGQPVDPVARFHLGNGAMLNRIMHRGDISKSGLSRAAGLMVNYLYDLPRVEDRHEAYADASTVAASKQVTNLLPSGAEKASKRDNTKGQAA